jgi:hypothetical protein
VGFREVSRSRVAGGRIDVHMELYRGAYLEAHGGRAPSAATARAQRRLA